MGFDLDRLERLAGGLAVLFYVLLFLAFITAITGSGAGGLLLLVLGGAAHVGRVGLEDFVERRRELGGAAAPDDGDAGERAIGLRLAWLPEIHLPRRLDLGGIRSRAAAIAAGGGEASGRSARIEGAGRIVAGSGEAAGAALGRAGVMLGAATSDVRASFAALVAEIRERPARASRRSVDPPRQGVEDAPAADLYDGGFDDGLIFADNEDDFAVTDSRYEDFDVADDEYEDFEGAERAYEEPAESAPRRDAPTAQERYEARQRARADRGEAEPIVAAVEEAETQRPQRVQRRQPGARPDPLRTRRPTRSF